MILWIAGLYIIMILITSIIISIYLYKKHGYVDDEDYLGCLVLGFIWPATFVMMILILIIDGWIKFNKYIIKHINVK